MDQVPESSTRGGAIVLSSVLEVLEKIAPLEYAEEWDNAGLLLEPIPAGRQAVSSVLLTIDLTEPVIEEACDLRSQLVVAYHPPIFEPLANLTQRDPRHRTLMRAIGAGVAVYSPHTALDAAPEGVNDWLADGLAPGRRLGIGPRPTEELAVGQGRLLELDEPLALHDIVDRIKRHLGLDSLRVAAAQAHEEGAKIRRIALCAGAGTQVVSGADAQLYLTGEMRHHDVLAALERGRTVVLCEHTNSERGYLPRLRDCLCSELGGSVTVEISAQDSEPLETR